MLCPFLNFLKNNCIYLGCSGSSLPCMGFLWLWRVGAALHCSAWSSHCGGFSCCRARALGTQASVVVVHRLSCSVACGIFPDQGLNLCPLHWLADSYPLCHQGSPDFFLIEVLLMPRKNMRTRVLHPICVGRLETLLRPPRARISGDLNPYFFLLGHQCLGE